MSRLSKKEENLLHLFWTSRQFPKGDPDNAKIVESLVKKRYLRYRPSGRLETTGQGAEYVDTYFMDMPLGPGQVSLQGRRLGRIDACYDYLTRYGKIFATVKACFQGTSTYGDGKATFTSYDADGYYMPGHSWDTKMSWSDFFDRMEKFKARRMSGLGNRDESPMPQRKRTCFNNDEIIRLLELTLDLRNLSYAAGKEKDYHYQESLYNEANDMRKEAMDMIRERKCTRGLANPPFSPYHHKTEAPGIPGHHRLSGFNRQLAKAISRGK